MKRVLIVGVLVFLGIAILGIIYFFWASYANKVANKSNPIDYESKTDDAKKALLVYQRSRTSFASKVAVSIAEKLSENGYDVLMNYPGDYMTKDLSEYDLVILQSPIYMAGASSVLADYIKSIENYGDAKVIFCCTGMLNTMEEITSIKELFANSTLDGLIKITQSEFKNNNNLAWDYISELLN